MMVKQTFKNKVVVVTGAGSGIGKAICRKFGREGSAVGLIDVDKPSVMALEQELQSSGVVTLAVTCDISCQDASQDAVQRMIRHFGGIDVLINNAGITQRSSFVDNRISVYRKVMDVNFFGALYCTKAAIDSLLNRKGTIIVIESIAGVSPLIGRTAYCASKHALHGLFTSLRCEIGSKGVHVMLVCPGFVRTNLQNHALSADGDIATHPRTTIGKEMMPEQVAEAIYKGALEQKNLMVLTLSGKLGYWVSRLVPTFYERLVERLFSQEMER